VTRLRSFLAPVAAGIFLWALFVPSTDPATERLIFDWRLSAIVPLLAGIVAARALWRRPGRIGPWLLAVLVLAAALLQFVAAVVSSALDRPLDLYFDLRHVPSLVGLFTQAEGAWAAAGIFALAAVALSAVLCTVAGSIGAWQRVLTTRARATTVLIVTLAIFALGMHGEAAVSFAATDDLADQGARLARATAILYGLDHRYDAALQAPEPPGDLAALAGRDVYLIFIESYGAATLDEPDFAAALAPALQDFADAAGRAGYGMRSSRLVSPVFGAGSWLAHGTLASGLKLDPFLDELLIHSRRQPLGRRLAAAGHRTIAVMPGIKKPWPEAAFWGFEQTYFARDLGYGGPAFGWFDIPDQYTLARFATAELAPGHPPLFAEIVLVSSHTPFAPVPPFLAGWDGADMSALAEAQRPAPDWTNLEQPYLESIAYDLRTLADWLARLPGNGLVIVLGDHQPPGLVSGATSPWTVPIHVLSRDPALLAPFTRRGYVAGMVPPRRGEVKGMESFLGEFLAAFSTGS
jgi:hypothetical protein